MLLGYIFICDQFHPIFPTEKQSQKSISGLITAKMTVFDRFSFNLYIILICISKKDVAIIIFTHFKVVSRQFNE